MATTKWSFEAEYIQSCNCDYGCPCNFNALPTHGGCEALIGYRIREGSFDGTKLDGVKFAWGLWWPEAIHMGNGVSRVYFDPSVRPAQRKAIQAITGGQRGGGVFAVFPKTFARVLQPKTAKIEWKFAGYDSVFYVDGIGEVRCGHIRNPVTSANFEGQVFLPFGINWKKAHVVSIEKLSLHDEGELNFDYENTAGFVTVTKYSDKGPVYSRP